MFTSSYWYFVPLCNEITGPRGTGKLLNETVCQVQSGRWWCRKKQVEGGGGRRAACLYFGISKVPKDRKSSCSVETVWLPWAGVELCPALGQLCLVSATPYGGVSRAASQRQLLHLPEEPHTRVGHGPAKIPLFSRYLLELAVLDLPRPADTNVPRMTKQYKIPQAWCCQQRSFTLV